MILNRLLSLALGLGWMAGYRLVTGALPSLPPVDAFGWLFWLAGALGVAGAVAAPRQRPLRRPPRPALASLLVAALGATLALAGTGSLLLGGLGAVLAAEVAVALGLAVLRPSELWLRGTAWVAVPLLIGLAYMGARYSALPLLSAVLLVLAPAGARAGSPAHPWRGVGVSVGFAAVAVAVGLAEAGLPEEAMKLIF